MGFRTVVVLFNDQVSEWKNDPALGKKISNAMNFCTPSAIDLRTHIGYGQVVECAHADTQTLAILDSYNMTQIAHSHWCQTVSSKEVDLGLLKQAAQKLGYKIVKA